MINKCLSSTSKDKMKNCEGVDTFLEVWASDFMEGSKESQIRWLKEFMDQLYGVNSWDNITDIVPGKGDDLINFTVEDSQLESLRKMKKHMIEKLNSGGEFQDAKVMEIIQKSIGI